MTLPRRMNQSKWTQHPLFLSPKDRKTVILCTFFNETFYRKTADIKTLDDPCFLDLEHTDSCIFEQIKPYQKRKLHICFSKSKLKDIFPEHFEYEEIIKNFIKHVKTFYDRSPYAKKFGFWDVTYDVFVQHNKDIVSILFLDLYFNDAYEMQSFWDDFKENAPSLSISPNDFILQAQTTFDLDASVEWPLPYQWDMVPMFRKNNYDPCSLLAGIYE